MPLFDHPARTEVARYRTEQQDLPWDERLPRADYYGGRLSNWMPVQPDMNVPGQVWNPNELAYNKTPAQVDENGQYFPQGTWNKLFGRGPKYDFVPYGKPAPNRGF